jgi:hypothetical protein
MKYFALIGSLLLFTISVLPQRNSPASEAELAAITERGRRLYAYDEAAWHSTDAVLALKPATGSFDSYIGQKIGDKWIVVYGKLNPSHNVYLIAYEATQGSSPNEFEVQRFEKPKEDVSFYLSAALAIEVAKGEFGKADRQYNVAVLPAKSNQLYVYLVPAQTVNGIFPLGGDVRYLISSDGKKIVERRQLHRSIIEFQVPKDQIPQSGYHTAVMDDIPEDTDVFHVLTRQPTLPEMIVTNKYVYNVKPDGSIMYLMTREAFLKIGKPSN